MRQEPHFSRHALIAARKRMGYSQRELAGLAGLCKYTVTFIEQGRTQTPQSRTIRKLARALRTEWAEFYPESSQN